ncbi:family 2 encapsulin nanocompartment cargo protein polyprenyl transferase [Kibdelosporangium aridum]|uniref:Geranylgeranyl diphosphate synthase, type I n=1 Tax=Kibdelosporangium aridum TaxID=2030 RepID=A0A1W2AHT8_KIBAR|nr:family 2 encapsulin nanocompartment cargo protein polyprenyl transferase [Kibdelosporangium aridum]SMC60062.1 geranylgeranyl diphosphate synthase, type I [Kibdelosporangium aridum]
MTSNGTVQLSSATEVLAWSREMTDPALRDCVAKLPSSMRRIAGYHFGWWDSTGAPTPGTVAGKAVRPALALLAAQASGGDPTAAVPAAVGVELVHNFSLLHDDVMDHDPVRRHRPTAWTVFGVADAILAGDAMLALATLTVSHNAPAVEVLSRCVVELCQGQSWDVEFEQRDRVSLAECCKMVSFKTGSLLACACTLGALLGGGDSRRARKLQSFGRHLGMAFQLVDDLLGIWGDPAVTGKPVHADLVRRKKSLPVVAALNSATAAGEELFDLYQQFEDFDPARAARLVEQSGGRDWARAKADEEMAAALDNLADCQQDAAIALHELARMITSRDH